MGNPIRQTAGNCSIEVYTDGWPLFPELTITGLNGDVVSVRVMTGDLHDLRYCIDRVLSQLSPLLKDTPNG